MRLKNMLIIGLLVLSVLMIAGCGNKTTGSAVADTGSSEAAAEIESDYISIPLSDLSSEAKFYEYNDGGVKIKYFAVLGSDEKPRTAFDACDVCGGYKGYQQVGNDIKCRNCGRVFSIDGLGTKNKGYGCWPSYLPHEIQGDNVIIKTSDLQDGRKRFV